MASKAVVDAVSAALTAFTSAPVYQPNVLQEPPAGGSAYVLIDYPVSDARQITIGPEGSKTFREEGVFRLIVHAKRGDGLGDGLTMADALAALFRSKYHGSNFETQAPSPPVIDDDNENGNYFMLSVAVPYRYHFTA